ncbi:hypothetical protein [Citricoccus muralis]|uniref:Uncharacterized protein n=1 Tax=Citricoccus muralis TaxID=169134 RepID=A0ABY8H658_9MICC|nr:hypothetical protein [Citricoccus muralis]WFP16624.1 hypothetical protein P8192_00405 [Citricoccus muralis]
MLFTADWWAHALSWGGLVAMVSGAVLIATLFFAPYELLSDYP